MAQWLTTPTRNVGLRVRSRPCSVGEGSGVAVSCGVDRRCGSDPVLPWLWWRPAAAAPIGLLAWEPPYATRVALEKTKRRKKEKKVNADLLRECLDGSHQRF